MQVRLAQIDSYMLAKVETLIERVFFIVDIAKD